MAPAVTVTTAATIDWSRYGIFQFQLTNGQAALALTFVNAAVGQTIVIGIKEASTHTATTVTFPTGTVVVPGTGNTQALTATDSAFDAFYVTCVAPGVYLAAWN